MHERTIAAPHINPFCARLKRPYQRDCQYRSIGGSGAWIRGWPAAKCGGYREVPAVLHRARDSAAVSCPAS